MQIVVQSTETIKPSSATHRHPRSLTLSLFDQLGVSALDTRILLFYSSEGDVHRFRNSNMSFRLKKSLSEALAEFYPLAGRFSDDQQSIECDDRGAEYTEAQVKAPFVLDQLLARPDAEEIGKFFPSETKNTGGLCTIKVTVFEGCGSMVIGVATSHGFGDAVALITFVNSWAAIARGDKIVSPIFGFADVLPPRDLSAFFSSTTNDGAQPLEILQPVQKLIPRRFVVNNSVIAALIANSGSQTTRPTRVQVVSALMFNCLIRVFRSKVSKSIFLVFPSNLRRRISPPLPPHHVGNFALVSTPVESIEPESFGGLVGQVGKMARGFDSEHIKNLLADDGMLMFNYMKDSVQNYMKNESQFLEVSSWCGIPYYEADFRWGKPTWAAAYANMENLIMLLDAKDGGVEAWVTLNSQDMARFVSEYELIVSNFSTPTIRAKI